MGIRQTIARTISEWLCPETHRDAQRYRRVWHRLDEARWWLGRQHPEAASLAQRIIDEDHWYWTSSQPLRDPNWTWQAPEWITSIHSFRLWLDGKPFEPKAAPPTP